MHTLNYSHTPSVVELREMRRLNEGTLERIRNELIALDERERLVAGSPGHLAELSGVRNDARRRQADTQDTIAELDRRIAELEPGPDAATAA